MEKVALKGKYIISRFSNKTKRQRRKWYTGMKCYLKPCTVSQTLNSTIVTPEKARTKSKTNNLTNLKDKKKKQ